MSIDARVRSVEFHAGGETVLFLEDRPAKTGQSPGCAGQRTLTADRRDCPPGSVGLLCGCDVWGGSESLMLGDVKIARRVGYTRIEWTDPANLMTVVNQYREVNGLNDRGDR